MPLFPLQKYFTKEYAATLKHLNATDRSQLLLPTEFLLSTVLPFVLTVGLILYIIHILCYYVVAHRLLPQPTPQTRQKLCYQITNAVMNLALGLTGIFYHLCIVPPSHAVTMAQIANGCREYIGFAAAQLGYQAIYAIPMGVWVVGESHLMLLHHLTVIVVSTMSACLHTGGFRYYIPFFYGLVEISSVPLAMMNAMKDHTILMDNTQLYLQVRIVFAVTFLYVRVWLFTPRLLEFGIQHWYLWTQAPAAWWDFRSFMAVAWASSMVLLVLQLYWGYLIAKGLIRKAMGQAKVVKRH